MLTKRMDKQMFKEITIQKSTSIFATLSPGQLYTNNIQALLYLGVSPSGMSAVFNTLDTDAPSEIIVRGINNTSNTNSILQLTRVLLC